MQKPPRDLVVKSWLQVVPGSYLPGKVSPEPASFFSMYKLIPLIGATALVAAGCGSSDDNTSSDNGGGQAPPAASTPASSGGGGQRLDLSADPGGALKFDKSDLSAKAGK